MRKPDQIEHLYCDFDGFFAGVEEQLKPALRGRPIGIVPFPDSDRTICIAANAKAKSFGVRTGTPVWEARELCPDIALVPQSPDLYARAHRKLINLIESVVPVDAVCSVDELACWLDEKMRRRPQDLALAIKRQIVLEVGAFVTCSIGFAPNRLLAKIACKLDKPNGITVMAPADLPGRLLTLDFGAIPGIGNAMSRRLAAAGITTVAELWRTQPKQLRALWGSVSGERFWYALHGYDIEAQPGERRMYGHSRVLPPDSRSLAPARGCAIMLATKAARRMRRDGYAALRVMLMLEAKGRRWIEEEPLESVSDDHGCLDGLTRIWRRVERALPRSIQIVRLGVVFSEITPSSARQLELFGVDDLQRQRHEKISAAVDTLNRRYGQTVVSQGPWRPPAGGYAGGKIAYSRVPDHEDFW